MFKKLIIGGLFTAMLAVLIIGGINRTMAKTDTDYRNESGAGTGNNSQNLNAKNQLTQELHTENAFQDRRFANSNEIGNETDKEEGQRGNGQGRRTEDGYISEASEPRNQAVDMFTELVEIQGNITSVDYDEAVIINSESGEITLEGRSLSYAISEGFVVEPGDEIQLECFYEGNDFEIVRIVNKTSGLETMLREPTGRPLWAGGGRTW